MANYTTKKELQEIIERAENLYDIFLGADYTFSGCKTNTEKYFVVSKAMLDLAEKEMEMEESDELVEELAAKTIKAIPGSEYKTAFILRKKMNAAKMIKKLSGQALSKQENIYYFWNIVGASLAYVKPGSLSY